MMYIIMGWLVMVFVIAREDYGEYECTEIFIAALLAGAAWPIYIPAAFAWWVGRYIRRKLAGEEV
jgi:hypothetical protein